MQVLGDPRAYHLVSRLCCLVINVCSRDRYPRLCLGSVDGVDAVATMDAFALNRLAGQFSGAAARFWDAGPTRIQVQLSTISRISRQGERRLAQSYLLPGDNSKRLLEFSRLRHHRMNFEALRLANRLSLICTLTVSPSPDLVTITVISLAVGLPVFMTCLAPTT